MCIKSICQHWNKLIHKGQKEFYLEFKFITWQDWFYLELTSSVTFEVTDNDDTHTWDLRPWQKTEMYPAAAHQDVAILRHIGIALQPCMSEPRWSEGVFSAQEADATYHTWQYLHLSHTNPLVPKNNVHPHYTLLTPPLCRSSCTVHVLIDALFCWDLQSHSAPKAQFRNVSGCVWRLNGLRNDAREKCAEIYR